MSSPGQINTYVCLQMHTYIKVFYVFIKLLIKIIERPTEERPKSIYFSADCCLRLVVKESIANFSSSLLKRKKPHNFIIRGSEACIVMFWRSVRNSLNERKRGFLEWKFAMCISYLQVICSCLKTCLKLKHRWHIFQHFCLSKTLTIQNPKCQ